MLSRYLLAVVALLFTTSTQAQSSAEIQKKLQRLNSFGRVMYIAAHPDDENTRVISWLSQGRNADVRYLSLTRGSGGQNMIGTELGPELGVLRTQELLAARAIDGGSQRFTSAVDFGYSKTADETLEIWDRETVLSDVVRAIREFQPDIIITRFPPDGRGGHGHHTASAILALEAFELAGDEDAFPEQINGNSYGVEVWQPKSIYWNTYSWRWDPNLDSLAEHDPKYLKHDVGGYDPVLGMSYNEIGSHARSQHRCQGFGVSIQRGTAYEYFMHMGGEVLEQDILEAAAQDWVEFGGTRQIQELATRIENNFDPQYPEASLDDLTELHRQLSKVSGTLGKWAAEKRYLVEDIMLDCMGFYVEYNAPSWSATTNSMEIPGTIRAMVRNIDSLEVSGLGDQGRIVLQRNEIVENTVEFRTREHISHPYWLQMVRYNDERARATYGLLKSADNPPSVTGSITVWYRGIPLNRSIPLNYRWSDRVDGEQHRPFVVSPRATATFDDDVLTFSDNQPKTVRLRVKSFEDSLESFVSLDLPEGWHCQPEGYRVEINQMHEERVVSFDLSPPAEGNEGFIRPLLTDVTTPVQQFSEIAYPHIPTQVVFGESKTKVVRLDMAINAGRIGYIQGAGDEVDIAIEQMGFEVVRLEESDLASMDLSSFQAVVVGIRAYNVHPWLLNYRDKLMRYVENGGHLVVQYNTATRDLLTSDMGPYPFALSRNRVTEEDAEVTLLNESHPFFTTPNQIDEDDFENWVQERGLYFAGEWSDEYEALISWHDTEEDPQTGGLLYAEYGSGHFTYTGISFFRELPAGVPGAFRLLANILSHE